MLNRRSRPDHAPRRTENADSSLLVVGLGLGALLGVAAYAYFQQPRRNPVARRLPDSSPGRTARRQSFGSYAVTGRTVTINKPRDELYAFWRDFRNLPKFMKSIREVSIEGDLTRWEIRALAGQTVNVETQITDDRNGEQIAWRSAEKSDIDTEGKVMFRDAPAGRGTEVEAIIAYKPPAGEMGRWIAKLFQAEPSIQGRRELKCFKMLMETGEIATNRNRRAEA